MLKKYTQSTQQISVTLKDENVILDYNKGSYYSLNEVGSFVWDLLKDNTLSKDEIIASVMENFEVSFETCESDLSQILSELLNEKLVTELNM